MLLLILALVVLAAVLVLVLALAVPGRGLVGVVVGHVVPCLVPSLLLHGFSAFRSLRARGSHWVWWLRNGRPVRGSFEEGLRLFAGPRDDSTTAVPKPPSSHVNAVAKASEGRSVGGEGCGGFAAVADAGRERCTVCTIRAQLIGVCSPGASPARVLVVGRG